MKGKQNNLNLVHLYSITENAQKVIAKFWVEALKLIGQVAYPTMLQ